MIQIDSILDKLCDVQVAVRKRNGVRLRMAVCELSMRGLYDEQLDQLTSECSNRLLSDDEWLAVEARVGAVLVAYSAR